MLNEKGFLLRQKAFFYALLLRPGATKGLGFTVGLFHLLLLSLRFYGFTTRQIQRLGRANR